MTAAAALDSGELDRGDGTTDLLVLDRHEVAALVTEGVATDLAWIDGAGLAHVDADPARGWASLERRFDTVPPLLSALCRHLDGAPSVGVHHDDPAAARADLLAVVDSTVIAIVAGPPATTVGLTGTPPPPGSVTIFTVAAPVAAAVLMALTGAGDAVDEAGGDAAPTDGGGIELTPAEVLAFVRLARTDHDAVAARLRRRGATPEDAAALATTLAGPRRGTRVEARRGARRALTSWMTAEDGTRWTVDTSSDGPGQLCLRRTTTNALRAAVAEVGDLALAIDQHVRHRRTTEPPERSSRWPA